MWAHCFLIILLFSGVVFADGSRIHFTENDHRIFNQTLNICGSGTVFSAVKIGFDPTHFVRGVTNWLNVMSLDDQAWKNRRASTLLTPEVSALRASPGFWLAITECYRERHGNVVYAGLIKLLVEVGHITNEVSTLMLAGTAFVGTAGRAQQLAGAYPVVSRFITGAIVSYQAHQIIQQLTPLLREVPLTPEDKKKQIQVENNLFFHPNEMIKASRARALTKIAEIDAALSQGILSTHDRNNLLVKREKILVALKALDELQNKNE